MVSQMNVANNHFQLAEQPDGLGGAPIIHELPRSLYHCRLDDQPNFLVPKGYLRNHQTHRDALRINPNCVFNDGGGIPQGGSVRETNFATGDAASGYEIGWVRDDATRAIIPFWLSPRVQELVNDIESNRHPSRSTGSLIESLRTAGILIEDADVQMRQDQWNRSVLNCRPLFRDRGFAPMSDLIHPYHVAALRRYYRFKVRAGAFKWGSNMEERRLVAHNEPVASYFHHQLTFAVSELAGEPLKPSYCYFAAYQEGAELARHTDREQCDFSLSMCIDYSPEPALTTAWPLMLDVDGCQVSAYQALGDAVFYRGIQIPHWRNRLQAGHSSTSIFFHYVKVDFSGPLN
jgi:hypothetical protein